MTGLPAINVPIGYSRGDTLPVSMTFYGPPCSEPELIEVPYAYEQATHYRRLPNYAASTMMVPYQKPASNNRPNDAKVTGKQVLSLFGAAGKSR